MRLEADVAETMSSELFRSQPSYDLFHHRVRPPGDLLRRLVLNGMKHVNGFEAGAAQGSGLDARGRLEFGGRDRNGGNSQVLQANRIVQTARGA